MPALALFATLFACERTNTLRTCEGGNTQQCYDDGVVAVSSSPPNYDAGRASFNAACRPSRVDGGAGLGEHVPAACRELAVLVRDAKGGPRDIPRAIDLFQIACKDGLDRACVDLAALLYSEEEDRVNDAIRAVVFFDQACRKVDLTQLPPNGPHPLADACDGLGRAYQSGVGVLPPAPDLEKAARMYDLACRANYAPGCVSAGALAAAAPRDKEIERAAGLYEQACRLDPRHGCFELAHLHAEKKLAASADETAVENYKRTCAIDPTRGCYEAALMMEEGRVKAGEGEIASLYNQACEHGNSEACARRALNRRW